MAKRYIDADRLINEISGNGGVFVYGVKTVAAIVSRINAQPTADVVEVVRCKDCKFNVANMEKDPLDITGYSGDDIVCSYFMTDGLEPSDYCSQGKRAMKERDGD